MAPLPDVPDVIRIDTKYVLGEDLNVTNRMFLGFSGTTPSVSDLNTLATAVHGLWVADLAPLAATNVGLESITITDLTSSSSAVGENLTTHSGTRTGNVVSAAACLLVNFQLGRRYRGGKPRNYTPFGVAADLSDPQTWSTGLTSATVTAWNSYIGNLLLQPIGSGVIDAQVNVSYYEGFTSVQNPLTLRWRNIPKLRTGGPMVNEITDFSVSSRLASQRRRNLRG